MLSNGLSHHSLMDIEIQHFQIFHNKNLPVNRMDYDPWTVVKYNHTKGRCLYYCSLIILTKQYNCPVCNYNPFQIITHLALCWLKVPVVEFKMEIRQRIIAALFVLDHIVFRFQKSVQLCPLHLRRKQSIVAHNNTTVCFCFCTMPAFRERNKQQCGGGDERLFH